jgi:hypothetical protein
MPVITSAQSVELAPQDRGQRLFTYRPDMGIYQNQKFYISIQQNSFEFKVEEDVIESAFGIGHIQIDRGGENLSTSTYLVFSPPDVQGGTRIVGTPVITTGTITSVEITTTGSGYIYQPTCTVIDPTDPNNITTSSVQLLYIIDPATETTSTVTYNRGSITAGIQQFRTPPSSVDQSLFALECDVFDIEKNKMPQDNGFNFSQFDYLNKVKLFTTSTIGQHYKLWTMPKFFPVFIRSSENKGSGIETNPIIQGQKTSTRVPSPLMVYIHDKTFTSISQLSWHLFMNSQTPHDYLRGPSASEWDTGIIASQMAAWAGPVKEPVYKLIEEVWCVVPAEDVTAGNPVTVQLHTHPNIKKLYVEQVCGVPDRLEVKLTNGTGTFKILTTTLEPGETASAKVGFKYWTNVETVTKILS